MTDPSVTEQDARRAELIADLRAFADWLEQNPWLPLPSTIEAREHLNGATDADPAATLARLRDIAQRTDGEVDESLTDRTRAAVNIGRVEYRLLAWHPKGRPGEPDPKDAEIERLRAELAEARAAADPDHGRTTAVAEAKPDTLGIAMGRAAVPQMQTRPQCSPQCLTAYALKSIAFNQHLDGCPNAVSRPDSAVISPAAES